MLQKLKMIPDLHLLLPTKAGLHPQSPPVPGHPAKDHYTCRSIDDQPPPGQVGQKLIDEQDDLLVHEGIPDLFLLLDPS